ncbi:MAG: hypothetical protein ACLR6B_03965 [Blautia sp.]
MKLASFYGLTAPQMVILADEIGLRQCDCPEQEDGELRRLSKDHRCEK